jgi:hypothetical protein
MGLRTAHQQLKEELGFDHFESRSWHGLHRPAPMTMIAYAYLQSRRLAEASGGKKIPSMPSVCAGQYLADPAAPRGDPRRTDLLRSCWIPDQKRSRQFRDYPVRQGATQTRGDYEIDGRGSDLAPFR